MEGELIKWKDLGNSQLLARSVKNPVSVLPSFPHSIIEFHLLYSWSRVSN